MAQKLNGLHLPRPYAIPFSSPSTRHQKTCNSSLIEYFNTIKSSLLFKAISLGVAVSLSSGATLPVSALPSLLPPSPATTPFSESKNLPTGLQNGKIRPCPSINPSCISTNPISSSFSFPWVIPQDSLQNPIKDLEGAIVATQKNVKIQASEETPYGKYLQVEVDGGFGRDVMEFLVKEDMVAHRAMATKVNYVYPFTTAFGDSKGQQERLQKILDRLGWYSPALDFMD